jgi:hypothetical protein
MADRLRVTELDFDAIKNNLKNFLRQQSEFSDYDFDGSGLSVLLDILAYNTHYNAYYLNMIANEAFLDTALLRDSVVSHAKTLGYVPYSNRAPRAVIDLTVSAPDNTPATVTIPKGYGFLSNQIDGKAYKFVVLDDVTATKANSNFYFESLPIYEGQLTTYTYVHDQSTNPKQIFTLPDTNIDVTTIRVMVSPSVGNTQTSMYSQVTDILEVDADSEVFFLQETRGENYQIYFGNNSVGKKLGDGNVLYISYLITNSTAANKANNFVATAALIDSLSNSLTNFTINPTSAASGGANRETIDEIKFSAPAQFTTQNRLVTLKDYETYIKKNYPAIDSISVWGGENSVPKIYGKVFVSIKPKSGYFLSEAEKQRIIDEIINPKSIVSISSEIVEPEYLYIIINTDVRYDRKKTMLSPESLKTAIKNSILLYKNVNLDKFNATFVVSRLQEQIDATDNSIKGNDLILKVQKNFTPILEKSASYTIDFNTPLRRGTNIDKLTSSEFNVFDTSGVLRSVILEEVPQSFTGISNILVATPGNGYTSTPTVTITGDGNGAEAEAVIVNGRVQSINVLKRGYDYSRAIVTLSGGGGTGATATASIDNRTGTLRTIYFDTNAERRIVDENIGTIDYDSGRIVINDIKIESVNGNSSNTVKIIVESQEGIIESVRNTILTFDQDDPAAISINLQTE